VARGITEHIKREFRPHVGIAAMGKEEVAMLQGLYSYLAVRV
jgi:hypothetical protein